MLNFITSQDFLDCAPLVTFSERAGQAGSKICFVPKCCSVGRHFNFSKSAFLGFHVQGLASANQGTKTFRSQYVPVLLAGG